MAHFNKNCVRGLDNFGLSITAIKSVYEKESNETKSRVPLSPSMASQLTLASAPQSFPGSLSSMTQSMFTAAGVSVTATGLSSSAKGEFTAWRGFLRKLEKWKSNGHQDDKQR